MGFAEEVRRGAVAGVYAAVELKGATWASEEGAGGEAVLLRCDSCRRWSLGSEETLQCGICQCYGNRQALWDLRIVEGRLGVTDPIGTWLRPADFARAVGLSRPSGRPFARRRRVVLLSQRFFHGAVR